MGLYRVDGLMSSDAHHDRKGERTDPLPLWNSVTSIILTLLLIGASVMAASRYYVTKDEHKESQDAQDKLNDQKMENVANKAARGAVNELWDRIQRERR